MERQISNPMDIVAKKRDCVTDEGYSSFSDCVFMHSGPVNCSVASQIVSELLLYILGFLESDALSRASRVNRHWRVNALHVLWRYPQLKTEASILHFAAQISQPLPFDSFNYGSYGGLVRQLDLGRVRLQQNVHSAVLNQISQCCVNLQSLRLWCESLDLAMLQKIVTASPSLSSLVVAGHLRPCFDACNSSLEGFSAAIQRLQKLDVDVGFDGDAGRNQLVSLVIRNAGPQMKALRLVGADSDEQVSHVLQKCPQLTSLIFRWAAVTEASVLQIAEYCAELRLLDLRGCKQAVTAQSLAAVFKRCSKLEAIDISFIGSCDSIIDAIVTNATGTSLHTIFLDGCKCSELSLMRLMARFGQSLQVLSISWFEGSLSDSSIRFISTHCPNLTKLDIRGSNGSASVLGELVRRCKRLRILKWGDERGLQARDRHETSNLVAHNNPTNISSTAEVVKSGWSTDSFLELLKFRFPSKEMIIFPDLFV